MAGAVDDLIELAGGEGVVVLADEPMCTPRIASVDALGEELLAQGGASAVRDDEKVERFTSLVSGGSESPALVFALGGLDFPIPVDGNALFLHCGEEVVQEDGSV